MENLTASTISFPELLPLHIDRELSVSGQGMSLHRPFLRSHVLVIAGALREAAAARCESRICHGYLRPILASYAISWWGDGGIILDREHKALGRVTRDANGDPIGVISMYCCSTLHGRGPQAKSCKACYDLGDTVLRSYRNHCRTEAEEKRHRYRHCPSAARVYMRMVESQLSRCKGRLAKMAAPASCQQPKHRGTILASQEEHQLVRALADGLSSGAINEKSFFYTDLYTQIMCATAGDARGFRWQPSVIQYWRTIKFYGGKRMVNILRGPQHEGTGGKGGRLPVDPSRARRYGPSNSTLKAHSEPIRPYPRLTAEDTKRFSKSLGDSCKFGLLCFDEVQLQTGYRYLPHLRLLIGASSQDDGTGGSISVRDARKHDLVDLQRRAGTHALQFFWTPLDGRASIPVTYYVTSGTGGTPEFLCKVVRDIVGTLAASGLQTVATASDGGC